MVDETAIEHDDAGLRRSLKNRHLQMIALGGIIGASLFIGSGAVISTVGPAAVLSYALGGLLVVLVMRMLGEMATAAPTLGSFMEYARTSLGDWAGFTIGWLYWYYWVGVVAFEAVVGAELLNPLVPVVPQWVLSLVLMFALTATNLVSVRSFGETEFWLASIKVITIVIFLLCGAVFVLGLWPGAEFSVGNIARDGFVANGWFAVLHGVVIVIFSYFGTEIVTIVSAESDEPERSVAKATKAVVWRVLLFYVGSVALLVMITPWQQIPVESSPYAAAFSRFGLPGAEVVVNVVVFTAVISVLNSGLYTASRMLFALQRRRFAPAWVRDVNRRGVPWKAILLSTLVGYVAVAASYVSPDTIFYFIINSAGAVALFIYAIIAASQLRMRRRLEQRAPERLKLRMWFFPYLTWATLVVIAAVIVTMGAIGEVRSQLTLSLVSLVGILLVYVLFVRPRRRSA
ncbi:gamma-aminobutyrate:proton symporter, AAT family (TC 2.A.3.1.5) [Saccharopolyspora kobensis]|uniref:Gamma-aminobutyrate:proton symporter, AAT family n=1 Tax=Saccharopolyspora kobensis TaxID=146035 RepID=A0A1H6DT51_9PSEU|nr:amino acid permease [Saccharopolyspora kobensis]SEG88419.1 gamma-aminobutyrate:proton symporter, AAT family (TC 2.A.3.1.5) [Saccharopolyspora kobensis]SFE01125.1 gamma-aminobutyrate:proton symporter, AAT family [Saccharopolyspora kobensis]